LSELRLVSVDLVATESFCLPQLESIQLVDITSDRPVRKLFNPSTVPHLRALLIIDQEEELSNEVFRKLLEPLAAQLDLVSLLLNPFLTCSPSLLSKLAPKTLFEYAMRARVPPEVPIHHLRLYPTSNRPPRPDASPELLSRLASHLRNPARLPLLLEADDVRKVRETWAVRVLREYGTNSNRARSLRDVCRLCKDFLSTVCCG